MELASFIEQSLVDIVRGVREANKKIAEENEWKHGPFILNADARGNVEFDVAVTASASDSTQAGGGIQIHVVKAQVGGEERRGEERVSRIRFIVARDQMIR